MSDNVLRIGIGGPVGTGKTALTEALVPLFLAAGRTPASSRTTSTRRRTPTTSVASWPASSTPSGSSASRRGRARTPPSATTRP